ncbi:hypothetical protein EIK77_005433 [Talaromyces pinophilus]|nr:hypothetical protein EIK77_005433 [Talaromyces pinophilus]
MYDVLLHLIDVASVLHEGHDKSANLLHYTKEICVSSPFHRRRTKRCLHNNDDGGYDNERIDDSDVSDTFDDAQIEYAIADDGLDDAERHYRKMWTQDDDYEAEDFRRLKNRMLSVLLRCKPDGLRTFAYAYISFITIFNPSILMSGAVGN